MTARPKRILFAQDGGAKNLNAQAKNSQHILGYWQSRDYRPMIASFSAPDGAVAANANVDILRVRGDRLWHARAFAMYMRNIDAVFSPRGFVEDWLALKTRASLGRRVPIITTIEGLLGEAGNDAREREFSALAGHKVYTQNVTSRQLRRIDAIFEMADHVIAISPFLARMGSARWGSKISMLPLGVDDGLFRRTNWTRSERPRVVGAGTVYARKRPELFLKLAAMFPDADFVWFGEGEMRQALRSDIARLGLRNIDMPGAVQPEVLAREFAASDIFVLPSFAEGVPKATQEAAASGLAQIVFGFYEAPTVIDGKNGFVVWSDSELTARLAELLHTPSLIERMGLAGTEMAAAWSWDVVAARWEQRIIEVLEGLPAVTDARAEEERSIAGRQRG